MKTAAKWRAGAASDTGLQRTINEDRVWMDEARGIFLVVDGLGGHTAGEIAAATAVDVISQTLQTPADIGAAISAAGNEIYRLTTENPALRGMACVLTLAMVRDEQVFVGHVGDSRLYLFWNGKLQKMTFDHSPVGEQEDQGLLTEEQAMRHPRRNEVFRDVGSAVHRSDDEQFIETSTFAFPEDAALLLCSDGLSDCVTAAEISEILEQFNGDAGRSAQRLVEAANATGGRDNISVVLVAGPQFHGVDSNLAQASRARHAATRAHSETGLQTWIKVLAAVLALGAAALFLWRMSMQGVPTVTPALSTTRPARTVQVNPADARGIIDALVTSASGDTISVPAGDYLGPLLLKDGVSIIAETSHGAVVRCDASAASEQGVGMVARGVRTGLVKGLRIASDDTHPLKTGILLVDSSVSLVDMDVSGAVYSGVRIEGHSKPTLREDFIHGNGGAGLVIRDMAAPLVERNQIMQNGLMVNAVGPGIDIGPMAKPLLKDNLITGNGTDEPLQTGRAATRK